MAKAPETDNTTEINEEELRKKRAAWAELNSTLDHIFSGAESDLLDSFLIDYTPISQSPSPDGKLLEEKAPGLSFGTIFRAIGFAFRHPVYTYNLVKAAREGVFTDPDFQRDLVANPKLWSFIQKTAEKLPQIGKVLGWFGIDVFKEQKILDTPALTILKNALTDAKVLNAARELTIATMSKNPDWTQISSDGLALLAQNPNFDLYFKEKRSEIRNYTASLIIGIIDKNEISLREQKEDLTLSLRSKLEGYGIQTSDLTQIADIVPILLDQPDALRKVFDQFSKGDYVSMVQDFRAMAVDNEDIAKYIEDNKQLFSKTIMKSIGVPDQIQESTLLSASKVGKHEGNIAGIFEILMKGKNQDKINQLFDLYQKAEWIPLIKEACRFMQEDKEFAEYLNSNKENFALIVDSIVDQSPVIKTWTAGANLGSLAGEILKDPGSVRLLVESTEGGKLAVAKAAVQVLATKAMDGDFRNAFAGAIYNVASGWLVGGGVQKQELVNGLLQAVSQRDNPDELPKLSKLLQEGFEGIELDEQKKNEAIKLLASKTLFDEVAIKGNEEPLKLENLIIDSSFVNSRISNVSFQNTIFQNSSFIGAAISDDVKFEGCTIDSKTLSSMVDALRKGRGNLNGAKLVGDISGIDLSGISLQNADLSEVTSMQDVNLESSDLTNIRCDPKLFIKTYNLGKSKGFTITDILSDQKTEIIGRLASVVSEAGKLSQEAHNNIRNYLDNLLTEESSIGSYVRKMMEASVKDISGKVTHINPESLKHAADYRDRTARLLTALYENKDSPEDINKSLLAQIMTDKISERLFGEGANRGQDFMLIDQMMQGVVKRFADNNPNFDLTNLLEDPRAEQFLVEMTLSLKAMSHSTAAGKIAKFATAGAAEGGIFLKKEDFTKEITENFVIKMEASLGEFKLSDNELNILEDMSEKIGVNLFGDGTKGSRKDDVSYIFAGLKQVFGTMKLDQGADHVEKILKDPDALIGDVNEEWRTGLTKLYYDNASYTTAGLLSGGIYLDKTKILDKSFLSKVLSNIGENSVLTSAEQEIVKDVTLEISQNLFEGYGTSSSAEYTGFIYNIITEALSKVKEEKQGANLVEALNSHSQAIVGEINRGWLSTSGTALTGLFLNAAKRSKGGGGARYLEREAVRDLFDPIKKIMDTEIGDRVKSITANPTLIIDGVLGERAKELVRDVELVQRSISATTLIQPLKSIPQSSRQDIKEAEQKSTLNVSGKIKNPSTNIKAR